MEEFNIKIFLKVANKNLKRQKNTVIKNSFIKSILFLRSVYQRWIKKFGDIEIENVNFTILNIQLTQTI